MKKTFKIFILVTIICALGIAIMFMPLSYKKGIDGEVAVCSMPLYIKLSGFIYRDYEYRRIAREITYGIAEEEDKVLAIYHWTVNNIRKNKPKDWPVIDDHILNIIIRGYGAEDQIADVFTTLCVYNGIRAFWERMHDLNDLSGNRDRPCLVLSFVRVGPRWLVFDVYGERYFLNNQKQIADVNDLLNHPELVKQKVGDLKIRGVEYSKFFNCLKPVKKTDFLRPEEQMPGKRILVELKKIFRR